MAKDLGERYLCGGEVWAGRLLHVHRDLVRLPDGRETVREYIRHPGAVCIVPLLDDGQVVLVRQYRYAHGRDFVELPAGKKDPGEDALATAKRELAEETGYRAREWRRLGAIHPSVAYTDEAIELFVARGLAEGRAQPDHGEFLEVLRMPLARALEDVRAGRITDAKTVCALFWAERFPA
jgi:ADP-ribose pyrophosphatase